MTFREILAKIIDETPGALAGAIMSRDGIPIEEYETGAEGVDLNAIAVEFEPVLEQAKKVAGALLGGNGLEELLIVTGGPQVLFRPLDDEYFVVVVVSQAGLLGKARYLVRSVVSKVQDEL